MSLCSIPQKNISSYLRLETWSLLLLAIIGPYEARFIIFQIQFFSIVYLLDSPWIPLPFMAFSSFSTWSLYISRDRIYKTAHHLTHRGVHFLGNL